MIGRDPEPRAIITVEEQDPAEDVGPLTLHARGIRTENQSSDSRCHAITTAQPNVTLDVSGELTVSPASDPAHTTGAVLHNVAPGGFDAISIAGIAVGGAPLFDCTGDISSLQSSFRADTPGRLDGRIGFAVVDWRNGSADPYWVPFLAERARLALTPAGLLFGRDAVAVVGGVDRSLPAAPAIALAPNEEIGAEDAASGRGVRYLARLPAGLLVAGGRRRLQIRLHGDAAAAGTLVLALDQAGRAVLASVDLPRGGGAFTVELLLQPAPGAGLTAGGTIQTGAAPVPFRQQVAIDPAQAWTLRCTIGGADSKAVRLGPTSFLLL